MSLTQRTDHVTLGQGRLLEVLQRPNMKALLGVYLTQIQELENVLFGVFVDFVIDDATGEQLDLIGRIVGQSRNGRVDDVYRTWLKARILVNRSSGTLPELIAIVRLLVGTEASGFHVLPVYPKAIVVTIDGLLTVTEPAQLHAILLDARAGSERLDLVTDSSDGDPFAFLGYAGGDGFGDADDATAGGTLTSVLSP